MLLHTRNANAGIRLGQLIYVAGCMTLLPVGIASALTVPYTENFPSDAANWRLNSTDSPPLSWVLSGGPDSSSYVSSTINFNGMIPSTTGGPIAFRGQSSYGSSSGAFVGNWVTAPVITLTAYVRQNTGIPITFFTRFATTTNSPGAAWVSSPVSSGVWTQLNIPISFGPQFTYEGAPSPAFHNSVFSNLGNIQFGALTPAALTTVNQAFNFDLDQVSITPEPGAALLLACALLLIQMRRARALWAVK